MGFFEFTKIFIYYIAPWSLLPPIVIGIKKYKSLTRSLIILLYFIIITTGFSLSSIVMGLQGKTNLFLFHIYSIFEFGFIAAFYSAIFYGNFKKIVMPMAVLFGIASIVNMLYIQTGVQYNTYTRPFSAMVIVIFSLMYINRQNMADSDEVWSNNPLNWINTGILIYFASSLLTFVFSNYFVFQTDRSIAKIMWTVNTALGVFQYILFAVGYYKYHGKR